MKRTNNEDAYYLADDIGLYLVADGMGGAARGEVASQMIAEAVGDYVRRYVDMDIGALDRYDFFDPRLSLRANTLMQAIHLANSLVYNSSIKGKDHKGMGSTVAAIMFDGDDLLVANVGDSRVYRSRPFELARLTDDHRLAHDPKMKGIIDPTSTMITNMGNVLTRAMGVSPDVEPDLSSLPYEEGDIFLLASDGLTDMVPDEMIAEVLQLERPLEKKVKDLIQLALANGGTDNVTVVLTEVTIPGRFEKFLNKITKSN